MSTVEPNSLIARANASAVPAAIAGNDVRQDDPHGRSCAGSAPRDAAACSISVSSSISTGCTVRTTNGSVTNSSATTTPARA